METLDSDTVKSHSIDSNIANNGTNVSEIRSNDNDAVVPSVSQSNDVIVHVNVSPNVCDLKNYHTPTPTRDYSNTTISQDKNHDEESRKSIVKSSDAEYDPTRSKPEKDGADKSEMLTIKSQNTLYIRSPIIDSVKELNFSPKLLQSEADSDASQEDVDDIEKSLRFSSQFNKSVDIVSESEEPSRLSNLSVMLENDNGDALSDSSSCDDTSETNLNLLSIVVSSQTSTVPNDEDSLFDLKENLDHRIHILDNPSEFKDMMTFPHRPQHRLECEICCEKAYGRRRFCCDFKICNQCIAAYVTIKVKDGKIRIECPNNRCNTFIHKDEIFFRLSFSMRERFTKYLIDANADPYVKTCPSCSVPFEIDPALLDISKKKLESGLKVVCRDCKLEWCYLCQSPFHAPISCEKYRKADETFTIWVKNENGRQPNAQKCPKCKVFIQREEGCNHMQCSRCDTEFCYLCGGYFFGIKFLGHHNSPYSIFGCKKKLLPGKPVLRRSIRGTIFGAGIVAGIGLAGIGLVAGAVVLGASVFIIPGYGILRLRREILYRKARKRQRLQRLRMAAERELQKSKMQ